MATTDSLKDEQDAYSTAFNEPENAAPAVSEDEAFGLTDKAMPAEEDGAAAQNAAEDGADGQDGSTDAIAIVVDGDELQNAAEQQVAKATTQNDDEGRGEPADVVVEAGDEPEPGMDMEKEKQRLKSWEGRLKAMEAKLKAAGADAKEEQGEEPVSQKAEAMAEAIEQSADQADTPADADALQNLADQVESGDITPEEAMKVMSSDFGDDFVKMIEVITAAKAKDIAMKAVDEMRGTVDEIIADIRDTKTQQHFEKISSVHPDFADIGASEEFKQYVESMPDGEREAAIQVIGGGSAKQIIQLLSAFKESSSTPNEDLTPAQGESVVEEAAEDTSAMDDAEGVRSGGMKLPDQPKQAGNDDYETAWNEA